MNLSNSGEGTAVASRKHSDELAFPPRVGNFLYN